MQHIVVDTGWIEAGAVRTGVPVRLGLVWPADPGVIHVTARCDQIPSTVARSDPSRELRSLPQAPFFQTIEWITVQVDGTADGRDIVDVQLGFAVFA